MAKLMRNMVLLAKIQPAANTDAAPTAPLNSILCRGLAPKPVNAEFAERNLIRPYFGNMGKVQVQAYSVVEFEVELAGSGAAGTAPKWGPLLRGCAFSETISAGVKVDYAPITSSQEFLTLWVYLDGVVHKMTDCKGTVSFALSAKGIPVMKYTYTGYVATNTDVALPTNSDFSGFTAPLAVNKVNTPTFTLHGVACKTTDFNIDMANQVEYRNYIGSEGIYILDRKPSGNATFEFDAIATKDWFTVIKNGTLAALQMIHGATAGNIIQIDAPKVQITDPAINDDNGIAMLGVNLELQPNAGNDEIVVSVK